MLAPPNLDHYTDPQEESLVQQGEQITQAIAPHGYLCRRLPKQIAWEVSRISDDWRCVLMWLPRPVAQWRLLPTVANCPYQREIYRSIEFVLGGRK